MPKPENSISGQWRTIMSYENLVQNPLKMMTNQTKHYRKDTTKEWGNQSYTDRNDCKWYIWKGTVIERRQRAHKANNREARTYFWNRQNVLRFTKTQRQSLCEALGTALQIMTLCWYEWNQTGRTHPALQHVVLGHWQRPYTMYAGETVPENPNSVSLKEYTVFQNQYTKQKSAIIHFCSYLCCKVGGNLAKDGSLRN